MIRGVREPRFDCIYRKTGRHFRTRYKEDIHDIKYNRDNSKYAAHILDMQHEYGKTEDLHLKEETWIPGNNFTYTY
jgi:hypothetical protein